VSESIHKTLVSLGMSCQTTHQLRRLTNSQQEALHASSGIVAPSGLFDWLICPPASIIDLLDKRIPDFTKNSILLAKNRPYWVEFNIYFWHNFLVSDKESRRVNINETFEQEIIRWRYLRDRFSNLDPTQTVFVISNTQNNLASEVFDETQIDQYHFTASVLGDLKHSLARYFSTTINNIHLQVLTRKARFRGLNDNDSGNGPDNHSVNFLPVDHNEWKGSNQSWDQWWQQLVL